MNIRLFLLALFLLFILNNTSVASQADFNSSNWFIETFDFESKVLADNKVNLNTQRQIMVWLPPSYKSTNRHYPVIHYLHNSGWSNKQMAEVERIQETFERTIKRGLIQEFIFVVGDYTTTRGTGTFFGNNTVGGRWEDHIVDELVPEIDKRYRTLDDKRSRAISGDFLGGYGALRIAMHHPDVFSSVYALHPVGTGEGDQLVNSLPDWMLLNTATSFADLKDANGYTHAFLMMAQAFAPNPSKPPFFVDWVVELKDGTLTPNIENVERLRDNFTLSRLIADHADQLRQLSGIGFDWGRHDPTKAHVLGNRILTERLSELDIEHIAEEFNGDAWSEKWVPFGRVENDMLPFLQRHLRFE